MKTILKSIMAAILALAAFQAQAVSIQVDLDALFGHGEGYVAFDLHWGAAPSGPLDAWSNTRDEAHNVATSLRVWDDGDALRLNVRDYMRAGVYLLGPLAFGQSRQLWELDLSGIPQSFVFAPLEADAYGARVYVTGGPDFPHDMVIPPIVRVPDGGTTVWLLGASLVCLGSLKRRFLRHTA
jgi:hypothetical protein